MLYFAAASAFTGKTSEQMTAPLSASKLFNVLEGRYPGITAKVLDSCAVTVNMDYQDLDSVSAEGNQLMIKAGDEVGIIPPVSSG